MVSMFALSAVLSPLLYILTPTFAPEIGEVQRQFVALAGLIPAVVGAFIGVLRWQSFADETWSLQLADSLALYDQHGRCHWQICLRDLAIYEVITTMQGRHATFCIAFSSGKRIHKMERRGYRASAPDSSDFSVECGLSVPKLQLDESSYQQLLGAVLGHGIHPTEVQRSSKTWGDPAMRAWVRRRVWSHRILLAMGMAILVVGTVIALWDCQ